MFHSKPCSGSLSPPDVSCGIAYEGLPIKVSSCQLDPQSLAAANRLHQKLAIGAGPFARNHNDVVVLRATVTTTSRSC